MKNFRMKPTLGLIGSVMLVGGGFVHATDSDQSLFQTVDLDGGYLLAQADTEGKCGEGKCGEDKDGAEGKCGEGKCGEDKDNAEGKCGEGKCGEDKGEAEGKCGEGKCGSNG